MTNQQDVQPQRSLPLWVIAIVLAGALLMATGGLIALFKPAMLVSAGDAISGAVKIYAGYLVSRNLAMAAMLLAALGLRDRRALSVLMVLVALIQVFDTVMDVVEGRWPLVPGVLVFAIVFLAGAARIAQRPYWRSLAGRDDR